MVILIHQPFPFIFVIQWKSEIERDTILELSYNKYNSSTVHFSILGVSGNHTLKRILYLNVASKFDLFINRILFHFLIRWESHIERAAIV
jgi:hypothetical protein